MTLSRAIPGLVSHSRIQEARRKVSTTTRKLPRSLAPLPEESLAGYVLRLSHRLRRTPGRTAELCGLLTYRKDRLSTALLQYLTPEQAGRLAAAARLTSDEVHALTLDSLTGVYPPLTVVRNVRERTQTMASAQWALDFSSRFCPDCLAGDGSDIQNIHGGAWKLIWHLPVVFACPRHQRILHYRCPQCRNLLNNHTRTRVNLVKVASRLVEHPLQCRNPVPPISGTGPAVLCASRLDHTPSQGPDGTDLEHLIAFQRRLLARLTPGVEVADRDYFSDLIMAIQLIKLSWPLGTHLLPSRPLTDLIDTHVAEASRLLQASDRSGRRTGFRDPPTDPAQCGALLLAAEALLAPADPAELREHIQPLVKEMNSRASAYGAQIARSMDISPRLSRAMAARTYGSQGHRNLHAYTRDYTLDHVPAHLPLDWYRTYFGGFLDQLPPTTRRAGWERVLRQAASLRLAQLVTGVPWTTCAAELGSTKSIAAKILTRLGHELQTPGLWPDFEARVDQIADRLEADPNRIDYGQRRRALATWTMPEKHWRALTAGIPRLRRLHERADADLGTVLTYCQVTQGHYLHSPTIQARPRGAARAALVGKLGPLMVGDLRKERLRLHRRVTAYADHIAEACDQHDCPDPLLLSQDAEPFTGRSFEHLGDEG
ncbi:TniQ family protein [Streptomyces olivochromogenes]|uniref:TniQ family protein n=1 Tax=Streptomyces olivochromogenes TaxID=1963 RepID=UPI0036897D27